MSLLALLISLPLFEGCASKVTYSFDPYVSKRLEQDIDALCSFYVKDDKGVNQRVQAKITLRAGEYVKAVRVAPTQP
jgi:hypothetical protein